MSKRTAKAAMAAGMTLALSACTIGDVSDLRAEREGQSSSDVPASEEKNSDEPQPTTSDDASKDKDKEEPRPSGGDDAPEFDGDLASLVEPGTAIAVAGAGEAGNANVPAWSTSKVPVAIAALRHDPSNAQYVSAAISASDNAAAEAMWSSMGEQAGPLTQAVLADGGDTVTQVNTQVTRPGFTAFGQTQWGLAEQAGFASQLRCIQDAETIVQAMGAATGQAYGLGTIPGAIFKGGWGPDPSGSYGVRQFGLVPSGDGYVAVAIAANSPDGSYESGQALLTKVAQNLQANLEDMPQAKC